MDGKFLRARASEGLVVQMPAWMFDPLVPSILGIENRFLFRQSRFQHYKSTNARTFAPVTLRAVQLLIGHAKMDSTVRYVGVHLEDALAFAEAVEI